LGSLLATRSVSLEEFGRKQKETGQDGRNKNL
jgi:hypothetical protein